MAQADALSDDGYVPYVWTEFGGQKLLNVKVLYVQIVESTRQGLVQDFRFICKVKDPTIFGATLKTATTQGSDPTTATGTAIHAFSYPIIYGASTYSVTSTATNNGDMPVFPESIIVNGPVNAPLITNETTGEFIQVNTNLASSSDSLNITYDKDSLIVETGSGSVLDDVTAASTFFKIRPGGNEITLSGSSIGSGAYVEVKYRDGYPLS